MIINFSNLGGGGGGSYTLPTATASRLGGVKIGSGVTVTNDGTISVEGGSGSGIQVVDELPEDFNTGDVVFKKGGYYWDQGIGLPSDTFTCHFPDSFDVNNPDPDFVGRALGTIDFPSMDWNTAEFELHVNDDDEPFYEISIATPDETEYYQLDGLDEAFSAEVKSNIVSVGVEFADNVLSIHVNVPGGVESDVVLDTYGDSYETPGIYYASNGEWIKVPGLTSMYDDADRGMFDTVSAQDVAVIAHDYTKKWVTDDFNAFESGFEDDWRGAVDGDVCNISAHPGDMPSTYYDYVNFGWDFNSIITNLYQGNEYPEHLYFSLIENPDWDTMSQMNTAYASLYREDTQTWFGFGYDENDGWYWFENSLDSDPQHANRQFISVGDEFVLPSSGGYQMSSGSQDNLLLYNTGRTHSQLLIYVKQEVPANTYLRLNGEWVLPASNDELESVKQIANNAYGTAVNKVGQDSLWVSDWTELEYNAANIGSITVNNVDYGVCIHVPGATTELEHPKVTEIVTSPDGVLRILKMDQSTYDNLPSHDPNTLYLITPDNV